MKKKIIITVLSLMMLLITSTSYACNFQISFFGDPKEKIFKKPAQNQEQTQSNKIIKSTKKLNLKIPLIPMILTDEFGGEEYIVPIQAICKHDPSLNGTFVSYFYIENKLAEIRLERNNMNDRKLMDYAMKKYGKFNLPQGISKQSWRGSRNWKIGNDLITYIIFDIPGGQTELIIITSTLYAAALNEYSTKKGKWEDSQK
jgi:hypothetical protein